MGGNPDPRAVRMMAEAVKAAVLDNVTPEVREEVAYALDLAAIPVPEWQLRAAPISAIMPVWRPIETAPKTGERILAFGRLGLEAENGIGTVNWCRVYSYWQCDPTEASEYSPERCELTHWMPLPEPPQ